MEHSYPERSRQSLRLKGYDYSQQGAFFVTICTHNNVCLFGEVRDGEAELSPYGNIAKNQWNEISAHFPTTELDAFMIMPNHLHGIIAITDRDKNVTPIQDRETPKMGGETPPLRTMTLGQIIAYYKYQTTKTINETSKTPGRKIWQRNYYEHVVRNEEELNQIREYILSNPLKWELDEENPDRVQSKPEKNQ